MQTPLVGAPPPAVECVTALCPDIERRSHAAKLNVLVPMEISAISTGPQAGAFAILDRDNAEIVVFTLP